MTVHIIDDDITIKRRGRYVRNHGRVDCWGAITRNEKPRLEGEVRQGLICHAKKESPS